MRKQFAVLGLGSFGRSVALTLESMGCDVIVVDKSQETIQEISDISQVSKVWENNKTPVILGQSNLCYYGRYHRERSSECTGNKEFGRSNYWSCGES